MLVAPQAHHPSPSTSPSNPTSQHQLPSKQSNHPSPACQAIKSSITTFQAIKSIACIPSNQIIHHPHSKQSDHPPTHIPSNQIIHHPHSKRSNCPSPTFQALKSTTYHIPSKPLPTTFQAIKSSITYIPSTEVHYQLHSKQAIKPPPTTSLNFPAIQLSTTYIPSNQTIHHHLHSKHSNNPLPFKTDWSSQAFKTSNIPSNCIQIMPLELDCTLLHYSVLFPNIRMKLILPIYKHYTL